MEDIVKKKKNKKLSESEKDELQQAHAERFRDRLSLLDRDERDMALAEIMLRLFHQAHEIGDELHARKIEGTAEQPLMPGKFDQFYNIINVIGDPAILPIFKQTFTENEYVFHWIETNYIRIQRSLCPEHLKKEPVVKNNAKLNPSKEGTD